MARIPGRSTWEALQERLNQTVETVTRNATLQRVDTGVEDLDPPEDIDEFHDLYKQVGVIRADINQFVSDVVKPGVRIEADDDQTAGYFMGGDDAPDFAPDDGFLSQAFVTTGETRQPFYTGLKQTVTNRWTRGTILHELLKADADDPESEITGFKHIRPETVSGRVYENSNILLPPDPDDVDLERTTLSEHEDLTRRGEVAAYVQFDEQSIVGQRIGGFDESSVKLSQNDVLKQTLDPDIGGEDVTEDGVFGTSIIRSIAPDAHEYQQIKRDRARAIKTKAYGVWAAEFNTEVTELPNGNVELTEWSDDEQDEWVNDVGTIGPGDILGYDGSMDLKKHGGEVPDLDATLKHYVDDILTPLPAPKYTVGFETDINQFVTEKQDERYQRVIDEERQYQERSWTKAFREIAERHPQLDPEGLSVKIEPEEEESPILSLDDAEVNRLLTYVQALNEATGNSEPGTLVDDDTLRELILQLPEDSEPSEEELQDESDPQVQQAVEELQTMAEDGPPQPPQPPEQQPPDQPAEEAEEPPADD